MVARNSSVPQTALKAVPRVLDIRNKCHERKDSSGSEMKEIAQEGPDRISGEHTGP